MDIEPFELAPGCWILAIGVESADRGVEGLIGGTTTPKKYQAAWSRDEKWEDGKTMTFTMMEDAEAYRIANLQRLTDAPLEQ
ncbi:MAG: hypothetical protein JWP89_3584 [Schlesneria sp.]|nr:hypothetical protein [Schlesneria sp.]